MNKDKNKVIFVFLILAILPSIIMGILKISTYTNYLIWIWDIIMIVVLLIYCLIKKYKIQKKYFIYIVLFMIVIIMQMMDYSIALEEGTINKLYMILPIVYFTHFLCSFVMFEESQDNFNIELFLKKFIIFILICCTYNIIININNFTQILNFNNKYIGFSSFFNHRNGFGQLLFLGIISNFIILIYNKNIKYYVTLFIMVFNLLLTFSRTSILSTLVFVIIYYLLNLFHKNNKKRILHAILLLSIFCIAAFYCINNIKIINFFNFYIFRREDGLSGRDIIWKIALSKMNGIKLLTGNGIGTTASLLNNYGLTNSHNSVIEILLTGGIPFLIFYILIVSNIIKNILLFEDNQYKKVYLSFIVSFLVYIMFEKVLLFSTGYAPIIFTIFLVIIPKLIKKRRL